MDRPQLGSPVRSDLKRNCMLCTRNFLCRDPAKDIDYACSRFKTELDGSVLDVLQREQEEEERSRRRNKTAKKFNSYKTTDLEITDTIVKSDALVDVIREALQSESPVAPDLRVDDRDIRKPRNVIEWIVSPKFTGGDAEPFAKQMQVLAHTAAEWCPRCSDEEYFEDVPVRHSPDHVMERVVFLEKGKCPKCGATKSELVLDDELLLDPYEMVGIVGQRGTKSTTTAMLESYMLSKWATTSNIPAMYKTKRSSVFTCTYTATTFGQAKASFWDPLNTILMDSEWFRDFHKFLREIEYKTGEELYKHSETILAYRHKNIFCSPAAPSQRSLRGRTRISAVIDEAGWFKLGKTKGGGDREQMNGMEVFTALKRSLRTMTTAYKLRLQQGYDNHPKPYLAMISSPSALTDLIMTRFKKVQGSREVYSFKYPTWKFNPLLPKSEFKEEFKTDPVQAARDYGCEPPISANPWIGDPKLIESSFTGKRNAINVTTKRIRTRSGRIATGGDYVRRLKTLPYQGETGAILALDMGYNNNSLAFCIAHPSSIPDREDDEEEDILIGMDVIAVGEIIPRKERPINNAHIYKNIIQPLCSEFGIAHVIADRWESRSIMQDLEESLGIGWTQFSVDMQDFKNYKEAMYAEIITHPKLEIPLEDALQMELDNYPLCFKNMPAAHLAFQMATVQDTGNAIIKGENDTTDDILRACMVAYAGLQDEEILEEVLSYEWDEGFIPKPVLGHVTTAGNAKSSTSSVQNLAVLGAGRSRGYAPSSVGVIGRR